MKQGEYSLNGATIFLYKGETISDYNSRSESWDALVIPDGVTSIPDFYFQNLNIVEVFMADSVMEIGESVFSSCSFLQSIQFSRNLESIGYNAISNCDSLESIYIPHSCKMLGNYALSGCKNLMNIHVPQKTHLDVFTLSGTVRFQHDCVQASEVHSMFIDEYTSFCWREQEYFHFHEAIKNLDNTLMHRLCSSEFPSENEILEEMLESGLRCLYIENSVGYTPIECLVENPHSRIKQQDLINKYVLSLLNLL